MTRKTKPGESPEPKRGPGRPTLFTQGIAAEICRRIACGETLIGICRDGHMPDETTVRGWDLEDRQGWAEGKPYAGFSAIYARARIMQIEHEVEEMKEIADTPLDGEVVVVRTGPDAAGKTVETREVRREDMLAHRKLQIDTRKWRAGKIAWRNYGDRLGDTGEGDGKEPLKVEGGLPDGEP